MTINEHDQIRQQVRATYGAVARAESSGCCAPSTGCCAPSDQAVAELLSHGIGYSAEETARCRKAPTSASAAATRRPSPR